MRHKLAKERAKTPANRESPSTTVLESGSTTQLKWSPDWRGHGCPVDRIGTILPTGLRERVFDTAHQPLRLLDGNVALALLVFGNLVSGPMEYSSKKLGGCIHGALPRSGRSSTPPGSVAVNLSSSCVCHCALSSTVVVAVAAVLMSIWKDWRTQQGVTVPDASQSQRVIATHPKTPARRPDLSSTLLATDERTSKR